MPFGKRTRDRATWPFSTRVLRSFISSDGSPIAIVRVTSVVPSRYWPPESSRNSDAPLQLAVGLRVGAIVVDRAVGPRARDRVERQVLQRSGRLAELLHLHGAVDLGHLAGLPVAPRTSAGSATAPRHRADAPAAMPSTSTAFFFARGSITGSPRAHDFCARLVQRVEEPRRRHRRDRRSRACPSARRAAPPPRPPDCSVTSLPRCATSSGPTFFGLRNSSACPSANRNARPSGSGVRDTSPTANVEQPRDRRGRRDHRRIHLLLGQHPAQPRALRRRALARILHVVRHDRLHRLGRAIRPRRVDRVRVGRPPASRPPSPPPRSAGPAHPATSAADHSRSSCPSIFCFASHPNGARIDQVAHREQSLGASCCFTCSV